MSWIGPIANISRCTLCSELAWGHTSCTVSVDAVGATVLFQLPVCSDCYEPTPGYDPDDERDYKILVQRLDLICCTFLANHPRVRQHLLERLYESSDTDEASTSPPESSDQLTDYDLHDAEVLERGPDTQTC